jgi:protein-S-isoprenylcysteine O-methyltransferase Ste14
MTRVESFTDSEDGVMFPRITPMAVVMLALASVLQWILPIEILSDIAFLEDIDPDWLLAFGSAVAVGGLLLSLAGYWALQRRGADVGPAQPVTVLVTDGVFKWTRNPIYLGMWIALSGIALAFSLDWLLILIVPASVIVNLAAVRPEEIYLENKFGRAYRDFQRRVPRYFFTH